MLRDCSNRIGAIAAIVTSGWLFAAGGVTVALSAASVVAGRGPSQKPVLAFTQLGLAVVTLGAAVTVGRAAPRMWSRRTYRRRTVSVIALITTTLAALGILVTQYAGLIAIIVPSLTLLSLTSRTPIRLSEYRTGSGNGHS